MKSDYYGVRHDLEVERIDEARQRARDGDHHHSCASCGDPVPCLGMWCGTELEEKFDRYCVPCREKRGEKLSQSWYTDENGVIVERENK